MDPGRPQAEAVGISGCTIAEVGSWEQLRPSCGRRTRVIDARSHTVIPGFVDAHLHLLSYAKGFLTLALEDTRSKEECLQRVAETRARLPEGAWIQGHGWNHDVWPIPHWPHRADLDHVAGDCPVFLTRKDGHSAWLSTAALKACGVWDMSRFPDGVRTEPSDLGPRPTGLVQETAVDLVSASAPRPRQGQVRDCLIQACKNLNKLGITSVHDCGGEGLLPHLAGLRADGRLTLRCWLTVPPEALPHLRETADYDADDCLRVGAVKLFVDGSLGSRTARLLEPYNDDPANMGALLLPRPRLRTLLQSAADAGLWVAVHVIGDGALREVLDAVEGCPTSKPVVRLEHLQLIHPHDLPRLTKAPYIASMQPYHLSTDIRVAARAWGHRCRLAYAWASVAARVPVLAFGSDCPVEPPDPRLGLWAAVTRQGADGRSRGGWFLQERLGLKQALRCYTRGGAEASGDDARKGSIEPGKLADLVVLEGMLCDEEEAEIRDKKLLLTLFGGKVVHRDEALS